MLNKLKYKKLPKQLRNRWSYEEFLEYRMQEMSNEQIEMLATANELWEREKTLNDDRFRDIFNDKQKFYKRFHTETQGKYIKREILFLPDAYKNYMDFCERHKRVVIKPPDMYAGIGIQVVDGKTAPELIKNEYMKESDGDVAKRLIVEEYVYQAEEYMKIYPKSLNTIRVTTLVGDDGIPDILFAVNQFGQRGSVVDNDDNASIWASINVDTGIVDAPDIDDVSGLLYDRHPDTGAAIVGFCNPVWDEVKKLALELANEVPECRLVGWDIAVREDYSLELIEGNVTPELDLYQKISGKGLRPELGIK